MTAPMNSGCTDLCDKRLLLEHLAARPFSDIPAADRMARVLARVLSEVEALHGHRQSPCQARAEQDQTIA
jgi:hypothetical protein